MRIYFDCCCFQRPFDDQIQPRIKVEAEAVLAIFALAQNGDVELLASDILLFEINQTPEMQRRNDVLAFLSVAKECIALDDEIVKLAKSYEASGAKGIDALHLATASQAQADFFATCDDRLLKKRSNFAGIQYKMKSVLELITELTR
jgi:predicted nucleic acid-binding protein